MVHWNVAPAWFPGQDILLSVVRSKFRVYYYVSALDSTFEVLFLTILALLEEDMELRFHIGHTFS
jgi:hypothetical protein